MAIGADGPIRASAISASPSGASAPVRFSQDEGSSRRRLRAHRWESVLTGRSNPPTPGGNHFSYQAIVFYIRLRADDLFGPDRR